MSEQYFLAAFANPMGRYLVLHSQHIDFLGHVVHKVLLNDWEEVNYQQFDNRADLEKYLASSRHKTFIEIVDIDKRLI